MADSFFLGVDGGPTATWCDSHETWTEAEVDGAFSRQPCKFTDLQEPDQEDDEDERTALPSMTATMEGCVACGGGYCSCRVAAPAAAVPSLVLQFSRGGSEYMWGMNVITGETLQSKKENRQADEDESPPIPFPVRRADSDAAAAALRREEPRAPERGPSRDALPVGTFDGHEVVRYGDLVYVVSTETGAINVYDAHTHALVRKHELCRQHTPTPWRSRRRRSW